MKCGEKALVFCCSVMNFHSSIAEDPHSLAHSSVGQKSRDA